MADFDDLVRRGKIKRIFRARRKITEPELVSHITQRAAGKEPLFMEESDYLFMLASLKEISKKRSLEVYAFCLMPSHIHILLSPMSDELPMAMKELFGPYALMFNRKYERKGHLFGGPYRQAVCLDDSYLLAASLYIHMNPVRAGILNDPRDYRWSSVRLYYDPNAPRSFVNPDFVLGLLSEDKIRQKEIYADLLEKSTEVESVDALEKVDAIGLFRKKLAERFPGIFSGFREKKVFQKTGLEMLDEDEIAKLIKSMRNKKTRLTPEGRKARKFLIEQLISRGYKKYEIAEKLGVSRKTVYNILKTAGSRG